MDFKNQDVIFGKSCSRDFWGPLLPSSTLIDLLNTALASNDSVKTICMFSEGYRTQRGVTGPMNFKKSGDFFRKIVLPGFWGPWLPSEHLIDFANAALISKDLVQPINMISEGYRTHGGVTSPMNFKKGRFFSENPAPGFSGLLVAIQHLN